MIRFRACVAAIFFLLPAFTAVGQGFDDLKKGAACTLNTKLKSLVDGNDVKGLAKLLKSKPETLKDGSNTGTNDRGAKNVIPLVNDVVGRTLAGSVSIDMCRAVFDAGGDPYSVYNGETPIYQVMNVLAVTPTENTGVAVEVLDILLSVNGFDVNRRYRSLPPPFSYLLSENYRYLGNSYSSDYLSTELLRKIIDSGGRLNSFNDDGASLLLLANSTGNTYLRDYLLDNGVDIDKIADEQGNNAVFAAIAEDNLDLLKKIVGNYSLKLTTVMMSEGDASMSPQIYDYVTKECAQNSYTYDELVLFRTTYKDRLALVQKKYETMAGNEVSAAGTYEAIMLCAQRFPDLMSIVEPKKKSIAKKEFDSAESFEGYEFFTKRYPEYPELSSACRDRVATLEASALTDIAGVKKFEDRYPDLKERCSARKRALYDSACADLRYAVEVAKNGLKNHEYPSSPMNCPQFVRDYAGYYDPDSMIPVAKSASAYYEAVEALTQKYRYYCQDDSFVDWYSRDYSNLQSVIGNSAVRISQGLSAPWLEEALVSKRQSLIAYYDECRDLYVRVLKFDYRRLPSPTYIDDSDGETFVRFSNFTFIITDMSDYETDYVYYVVHGMTGGRLPGFLEGYTSYEEALVAGYCAGYYGFGRPAQVPSGFLGGTQAKLDKMAASQSDSVLRSWFGD